MKVTFSLEIPERKKKPACAQPSLEGMDGFKMKNCALLKRFEALVHNIQKYVAIIDDTVGESDEYPAEEIADILGLMTTDVLNMGGVIRTLSECIEDESDHSPDADDFMQTLLSVYDRCETYLGIIREAYSYEVGILLADEEDMPDEEVSDPTGDADICMQDLDDGEPNPDEELSGLSELTDFLNEALLSLGLAPYTEDDEGAADTDEKDEQVVCTIDTDGEMPYSIETLEKNPRFMDALTEVANTVLGLLGD